MAEMSALNSVQHANRSDLVSKKDEHSIKKEVEDSVSQQIKPEPQECGVCVVRSSDCVEIRGTHTSCGTLLADFLCKFTQTDFDANSCKHICKTCLDLINVLQQAELEYLKYKEAFEAILSKNPLFVYQTQEPLMPVKYEANEQTYDQQHRDDSEDEPLAVTKKKRYRKVVKRKKKVVAPPKRKPRAKKDSVIEEKQKEKVTIEVNVKKEDSEGSENSQLDNGFDNMFKLELEEMDDDDDDDSTFTPDTDKVSNGGRLMDKKRKDKKDDQKPKKKREPKKPALQCDQCDAKYTSYRRLEMHKEKHSEGKPPYICEICGAHYKHKRACDIHVALHKGISDWKCEECNKLFPSKGALQRHNNIHTGKLNYQCDLCGKSFIHTSSFKMHKLSHSGLKPHSCDVCGLALMTRSHLKRHKRVHSGEKRHECNICGKRFSERYNLVAHSKAHETAGQAAGEQLGPPPPRRRLFRCPFCQERFERRYMLERHVSLAHGRTLERVPATPRNTMSKLLKAQAAARAALPTPAAVTAPPAPSHTPASDISDTKEERSPDSRASSIIAHKSQLSVSMATITAGSWSGAYAAEFGLRADFPH